MSSSPAQSILPDEILEEIFLRLDAAADLARASAACTSFLRIVSTRRFRRRFRSLHTPPVLGFLEFDKPGAFHPAEPPHGSAAAARALAQASYFTFSFLGTPDSWRVSDARDGRVLLYRLVNDTFAFDIMVCDPLHRRSVLLPPIPDDLAADIGGWGSWSFDAFFDQATDKEEEEDLPFRVICTVQCQHKLVAFHFSSVTRTWRGVTFDLTTPLKPSAVEFWKFSVRYYAHGCFYWKFQARSWFVLDTSEMKLSVVGHPTGIFGRLMGQAIVEAEGGRLCLVNVSNGILELYYKTLRNNGVGTEEWQPGKRIPLPNMECLWRILGAAGDYLLLQTIPRQSFRNQRISGETPESHYFTMDIKTLLFEMLCVSNQQFIRAHLYASFPPPWPLPSI